MLHFVVLVVYGMQSTLGYHYQVMSQCLWGLSVCYKIPPTNFGLKVLFQCLWSVNVV